MKTIYISFSLLLIFSIFSHSSKAQCTIPNGGFTDWFDGNPVPWFGFSIEQITGRTGSGSAVRFVTSQGFPFPSIMGTAFACNSKANFLNGYFKSDFQNGPSDSLFVVVGFKLINSEQTGYIGSCVLFQTVNSWTPFHIPINPVSQGQVDSVVINFVKIGPGNSTVDFDDFTFSNTATGQTLGICQTFTSTKPVFFSPSTDIRVFPNPAKTELKISGLTHESPLNYEIKNMAGQTVATGNENFSDGAEPVIPLNNLRPGLYFLKVKNSLGLWVKKIQIH